MDRTMTKQTTPYLVPTGAGGQGRAVCACDGERGVVKTLEYCLAMAGRYWMRLNALMDIVFCCFLCEFN